jgi:putative hydrolase
MIYDYHTHTQYSHGKGTIEDNVKVAAEKGLKAIAITDHGPGHLTYGLKISDIPKMREDIKKVNKLYPDVKVLLGVEANTLRVPPYLDVTKKDIEQFDILLAGYHFGILNAGMVPNYISNKTGLFTGDYSTLTTKNTEMIIDALTRNKVDILTHPGDKGPFDIDEIAKVCQETETMIEINNKHRHLTEDEIKIASKYNVKFIIGSDAHVPEKVGEFVEPLVRALKAGLEPERIVNIELK